jgi:hypothetical protein
MNQTTYGCSDRNDFDRIGDLASTDKAAALKFLNSTLSSGACVKLTAGAKVFIEDISVWSGSRCVRQQGETECFWVMKEAVKQ